MVFHEIRYTLFWYTAHVVITNERVKTHERDWRMRFLDLPRDTLPKKLIQVAFSRADTGLKRIIFSGRVNWPLVHARGRRRSHANSTGTRTWQSFHAASGCLTDDAVYRNNRVHRFVATLGRDYIGQPMETIRKLNAISRLVKIRCDIFTIFLF